MPTLAAADDDPVIGRTIAGKYAITSVIGDGAMGTVYRARHVALETPVAIKIVKEHSRAENFAERFRREAQAASRLDHPNSVRVMDYGQEPDGLLYLVMELLDGRELAEVIHTEFPLPTKRIVSIMSQALAAIAVAHDQGVVHRDLKPENIMILRRSDDDGTELDLVKVCDFGIAKLQHAESTSGRRLTTQGEVIGTPEFMSPEQARGEELDARSDLYSMGVILFELLTSHPPFESDTALGLALMHVTDVPPRPSSLQPRVDPALERVCLKAMSKKREDRFQTAREMRLELRAAIDPSLISGPQSINEQRAIAKAEQPETLPPTPATPSVRAARRADTIETHAVVASSPSADRRKRGLFIGIGLGAVSLLGVALVLGLRLGSTPEKPSTAAGTPSQGSAPAAVQPTETKATNTPASTLTATPEPTASSAPTHASTAKVAAVPTLKTAVTAPIATVTAAPTIAPTPEPTVTAVPTTAPAPTPTVAPPPVPVPTATATATTTVAPATPFDPSGARATISSATATNGVPGSSVRASLNIEAISRCYRDALKAKGAPASGNATLQLSIDDGGRVTSASLNGAGFLPSMKGCVEGVARLAKIKGVDTGDAAATVSISFVAK